MPGFHFVADCIAQGLPNTEEVIRDYVEKVAAHRFLDGPPTHNPYVGATLLEVAIISKNIRIVKHLIDHYRSPIILINRTTRRCALHAVMQMDEPIDQTMIDLFQFLLGYCSADYLNHVDYWNPSSVLTILLQKGYPPHNAEASALLELFLKHKAKCYVYHAVPRSSLRSDPINPASGQSEGHHAHHMTTNTHQQPETSHSLMPHDPPPYRRTYLNTFQVLFLNYNQQYSDYYLSMLELILKYYPHEKNYPIVVETVSPYPTNPWIPTPPKRQHHSGSSTNAVYENPPTPSSSMHDVLEQRREKLSASPFVVLPIYFLFANPYAPPPASQFVSYLLDDCGFLIQPPVNPELTSLLHKHIDIFGDVMYPHQQLLHQPIIADLYKGFDQCVDSEPNDGFVEVKTYGSLPSPSSEGRTTTTAALSSSEALSRPRHHTVSPLAGLFILFAVLNNPFTYTKNTTNLVSQLLSNPNIAGVIHYSYSDHQLSPSKLQPIPAGANSQSSPPLPFSFLAASILHMTRPIYEVLPQLVGCSAQGSALPISLALFSSIPVDALVMAELVFKSEVNLALTVDFLAHYDAEGLYDPGHTRNPIIHMPPTVQHVLSVPQEGSILTPHDILATESSLIRSETLYQTRFPLPHESVSSNPITVADACEQDATPSSKKQNLPFWSGAHPGKTHDHGEQTQQPSKVSRLLGFANKAESNRTTPVSRTPPAEPIPSIGLTIAQQDRCQSEVNYETILPVQHPVNQAFCSIFHSLFRKTTSLRQIEHRVYQLLILLRHSTSTEFSQYLIKTYDITFKPFSPFTKRIIPMYLATSWHLKSEAEFTSFLQLLLSRGCDVNNFTYINEFGYFFDAFHGGHDSMATFRTRGRGKWDESAVQPRRQKSIDAASQDQHYTQDINAGIVDCMASGQPTEAVVPLKDAGKPLSPEVEEDHILMSDYFEIVVENLTQDDSHSPVHSASSTEQEEPTGLAECHPLSLDKPPSIHDLQRSTNDPQLTHASRPPLETVAWSNKKVVIHDMVACIDDPDIVGLAFLVPQLFTLIPCRFFLALLRTIQTSYENETSSSRIPWNDYDLIAEICEGNTAIASPYLTPFPVFFARIPLHDGFRGTTASLSHQHSVVLPTGEFMVSKSATTVSRSGSLEVTSTHSSDDQILRTASEQSSSHSNGPSEPTLKPSGNLLHATSATEGPSPHQTSSRQELAQSHSLAQTTHLNSTLLPSAGFFTDRTSQPGQLSFTASQPHPGLRFSLLYHFLIFHFSSVPEDHALSVFDFLFELCPIPQNLYFHYFQTFIVERWAGALHPIQSRIFNLTVRTWLECVEPYLTGENIYSIFFKRYCQYHQLTLGGVPISLPKVYLALLKETLKVLYDYHLMARFQQYSYTMESLPESLPSFPSSLSEVDVLIRDSAIVLEPSRNPFWIETILSLGLPYSVELVKFIKLLMSEGCVHFVTRQWIIDSDICYNLPGYYALLAASANHPINDLYVNLFEALTSQVPDLFEAHLGTGCKMALTLFLFSCMDFNCTTLSIVKYLFLLPRNSTSVDMLTSIPLDNILTADRNIAYHCIDNISFYFPPMNTQFADHRPTVSVDRDSGDIDEDGEEQSSGHESESDCTIDELEQEQLIARSNIHKKKFAEYFHALSQKPSRVHSAEYAALYKWLLSAIPNPTDVLYYTPGTHNSDVYVHQKHYLTNFMSHCDLTSVVTYDLLKHLLHTAMAYPLKAHGQTNYKISLQNTIHLGLLPYFKSSIFDHIIAQHYATNAAAIKASQCLSAPGPLEDSQHSTPNPMKAAETPSVSPPQPDIEGLMISPAAHQLNESQPISVLTSFNKFAFITDHEKHGGSTAKTLYALFDACDQFVDLFYCLPSQPRRQDDHNDTRNKSTSPAHTYQSLFSQQRGKDSDSNGDRSIHKAVSDIIQSQQDVDFNLTLRQLLAYDAGALTSFSDPRLLDLDYLHVMKTKQPPPRQRFFPAYPVFKNPSLQGILPMSYKLELLDLILSSSCCDLRLPSEQKHNIVFHYISNMRVVTPQHLPFIHRLLSICSLLYMEKNDTVRIHCEQDTSSIKHDIHLSFFDFTHILTPPPDSTYPSLFRHDRFFMDSRTKQTVLAETYLRILHNWCEYSADTDPQLTPYGEPVAPRSMSRQSASQLSDSPYPPAYATQICQYSPHLNRLYGLIAFYSSIRYFPLLSAYYSVTHALFHHPSLMVRFSIFDIDELNDHIASQPHVLSLTDYLDARLRISAHTVQPTDTHEIIIPDHSLSGASSALSGGAIHASVSFPESASLPTIISQSLHESKTSTIEHAPLVQTLSSALGPLSLTPTLGTPGELDSMASSLSSSMSPCYHRGRSTSHGSQPLQEANLKATQTNKTLNGDTSRQLNADSAEQTAEQHQTCVDFSHLDLVPNCFTNHTTHDGTTGLVWYIINNVYQPNVDDLRCLLTRCSGVSVTHRNHDGESILMHAVLRLWPEDALLLLISCEGLDHVIRYADNRGRTIFHYMEACDTQSYAPAVVNMLLDRLRQNE